MLQRTLDMSLMLGKHIAVNKKKKYYRQRVYYLSKKNIAQNCSFVIIHHDFRSSLSPCPVTAHANEYRKFLETHTQG